MLRDIPIKVLLLLGFLVSGLIPLMAVAMLSLSTAKDELEVQAVRQLESIRDLKAAELVRFFDGAARQVEVLAADPGTREALRDLSQVAQQSGGPQALRLRGHNAKRFEADGAYRVVHDRYYPYLESFAQGHGFYDLFLMEPNAGFTLFTVVKEADFGIRVRDVDSALRDVFEVSATQRRTAVSDTRPYGPSGDAPAQFIAAPVLDGGQLLGVVAVQISIASIDRIMGERSGMGHRGDAYLVGRDRRLRSDTFLDPNKHSVVASFGGTIRDNGADTEAARAALDGRVGTLFAQGIHARPVLSAFAPVDFHGVRWAIVAEIDASEIDQRIGRALNTKISVTIGFSIVLLVVLALAVSMVLSRSIARVIGELGTLIDKVLRGKVHERLDPGELPADFRGVAHKTNELAAAFVQQTKEKRQLEEVLQYNQRMESIGTLAGGIAHDFNNILTYMATYTELVAQDRALSSRSLAHVEEILRAIDRATALVAQIMLFGRQMKKEKRPVKVALLIKEAVKLLKATLPRSIQIRKNLQDEELYVMADPTQVHQVVMNLCTNAYHAMLRKGGVLTVCLERCEVTAGSHQPLAEGGYCVLAVSDTGDGIDPSIRDRIFEPFFTTKPVGQGTGMGLAVVHGIVSSHAGHIDIESAPGQGTTVRVFLPLRDPEPAFVDASSETEAVSGKGRVLLVDDEPAICEAVGQVLESLGYTVTSHVNPSSALDQFRAEPQAFDLVLTDLSMPGLDGLELTKQLRLLRPDLPIILTTGYSERLTEQDSAQLGAAGLLIKPYRRYALSVALRDALEASQTPP